MRTKRLPKVMIPCVIALMMLAMLLTGCSSDSENKLIDIKDPVDKAVYYINDGTLNQYYQDHTTNEQAVTEFTDSITSLREYLDGESFVDTGYYMGVNYDIDVLDNQNNTAGNFQLRVDAYLYTYPYEDEDGNPIYKYYENGHYYDNNNPEGTRKLVNALEIHNEAIKKSDISIEWYNGATNEVMIGLYFDGLNSNSDDPGNVLYVDIQGARRSFPEFGDTVLYQQLIRLLVHLSVEGLLSGLGIQSDAGTSTIHDYMVPLVGEKYKRVVNDDIISLYFYSLNLNTVKEGATNLLVKLLGPFGRKWDPLTYKYLGFRFSAVSTSTINSILCDMNALISPNKERTQNVLTDAKFHFTGGMNDQLGAPYTYTCDASFDYGWVYPDPGIEVENRDWYKEFDYGNYEFKGKLYVPSWDAQYDALIRTDMNPVDNTTNNVFMEFRDIANGELAIGIYYKNERSYLDITGLEYMYGWIDLEYLGFPQVYDEHLDLAFALRRFNILISNVIVSIVDGILDPASGDKKNEALERIMDKTTMTEKIEFSSADEEIYREALLMDDRSYRDALRDGKIKPSWEADLLEARAEIVAIREAMSVQYDDNYIREYIDDIVYQKVLVRKQESLFSANTETLKVDIELIKQMLHETGAGDFTTRQLINIIDSVLPYTLDQLAIMLGIPSAELMVEKTYFTLTLDVDTNLMTMIMYTDLGVDKNADPPEPSIMMWKLELTPTHFGEAVKIADVDFSKFKPLGDIYTYSGTLNGEFVFSSQETVDLSKLLSATIGESSGLNTPYILSNNTGLNFELIYDQFVTDNYVNDEGEQVPVGDPTGVWKREGRSAFDITVRIQGSQTVIIRLSSDDVSFNNEVYKKLASTDEKERSEAEHAMGYIWVSIECVYKNGQQAVPKVKIREDVFMASMSAYMNGETAINDDVSTFAESDFNLSLTSIISALCKDAYVVPEPEQLEITSSNETLQSLFRVDGLIGNIKVDAGFTYRVKGLQAIKKNYYMYQVGAFKDISGENPYTTALHETLRTHFYEDFRDEYEPLDYDFYVFPEDVRLDDGTLIEEGTIMVFELGAKKSLMRQPIVSAGRTFFADEIAENQDITEVKFAFADLKDVLVTKENNNYFYSTYYGKSVQIDNRYIQEVSDDEIYIYWQGIRDVVFYDEGEEYYYFDMQMALMYTENDIENEHYIGESVFIYKAEYRKMLFEYDPDSVEVTAACKTQYSPRTNGSFMGVIRRYYLTLSSRISAELGALHSVYYGGNEGDWPPQFYNDEDRLNVVEIYDDDGKLIDKYYDPIALFVMEPAEPLIDKYQYYVCTDPSRTTGIEEWQPTDPEPHVRCKWERSEVATFSCRFVIDWSSVTLKGYAVVTEVIVAEGMMGETTFPCRIIVTNREVDTEEFAVVYDQDNYVYRVVDSSVAVPGDTIPEKTYYVLNGDRYVFTTDTKFIEGNTYYVLEYYSANVPVIDSITIDPYEYLMAKYTYMSNTNNFKSAGYLTKEDYLEAYKAAEQRFIQYYFREYVFDISFAWERSVLYQMSIQTDYIAKYYSNENDEADDLGVWCVDEREKEALTDADLSVLYCDCDVKENGQSVNYSKHSDTAQMSENRISDFDRLAQLFSAFISEFNLTNDTDEWDLPKDPDDPAFSAFMDFFEQARDLFGKSGSSVAKSVNYGYESGVFIGLNNEYDVFFSHYVTVNKPMASELKNYYEYMTSDGGYYTKTKDTAIVDGKTYYMLLGYDECMTIVSRLFGYKTVRSFVQYISNMAMTFNDNVGNLAKSMVASRLKYDGAIFTENGSFVMPYAFKNSLSNTVLAYLIIDPNGIASIWLNDLASAYDATNYLNINYDDTQTIEVYGRCMLFDTPPRNMTYYNWTFDAYQYGDNQESLIKPAGSTIYLHTRFYGQLVALRVDVSMRKFSYVKFNVYNADGTFAYEDTFNPEEYPDYSGKYTANYYDSNSYVLGTQPVFVFLDERGEEHELVFKMSYITGMSGGNYQIDPSYELTWSDGVITNVGPEGSYFMEYVYLPLYAGDSVTEETRSLTRIDTREEYLTSAEQNAYVEIAGQAYRVYKPNALTGYMETLTVAEYNEESVPMLTAGGEKIAYSALTTTMKNIKVVVHGSTEPGGEEYYYTEDGAGYALIRTARSYLPTYQSAYSYHYMPMGSDTFTVALTTRQVEYSGTGLALTEEEKAIDVEAEGSRKYLYSDTDKDGYAEKLIPSTYDAVRYDVVTTYEGEIVPYQSLSDDLKNRRVNIIDQSGIASVGYLYRDVDGHAEVRQAVEYSSLYSAYTMFAFRNYDEFVSSLVAYDDLTTAEKDETVPIEGNESNRRYLYDNQNGNAMVLSAVYKKETEPFLTYSGRKIFYNRLSQEMKRKTVVIGEEEVLLYSSDVDGYALKLKVDYYPATGIYESLVRYELIRSTSVEDENVLLYNDFYEDNLFRFNEKTGKVEIRKASVYLSDAMENNCQVIQLDGSYIYASTSYFTQQELDRTVIVNGEELEQSYITNDSQSHAAVRLGYWYTENEWEEFTIKGVTFDRTDWENIFSSEMKSKTVIVRLKEYSVDLFRVNDGTSELLIIDGVTRSNLTAEEEESNVYAFDPDGNVYLRAGGYYVDGDWIYLTVNGAKVSYASLSQEIKDKMVKTIVIVTGEEDDFRISNNYYAFGADKNLVSEDGEGYAMILNRQALVEIREAKASGSARIDVVLDGEPVAYRDLTGTEKQRDDLVENEVSHRAQISVGEHYFDTWKVFTVKGYAYTNMNSFSVDMKSAKVALRPEGTEGELYKGTNQGYLLIRNRSKVEPTQYLAGENVWVEYGIGRVPLFNSDAEGLSIRSDTKQLVNRPFYVYYDTNGKMVYTGSEYRYEYALYLVNGSPVPYSAVSEELRRDYIVNDAGTEFPTFIAGDCLDDQAREEGIYYYDPDKDNEDVRAYAYRRIDISLNSDKAYDVATATLNFYSIFRLYTTISGDVYPISIVSGEIIENEQPGGSTKTEFPSVTVRALVECPKQDPLTLEDEIIDELDGSTKFTVSDVIVGTPGILSSSVEGYYQIDPLQEETATLPSFITVYFEGGSSHVFRNLEWYAYYDESTGIGYYENRSGVPIIQKSDEDGSYRAVIPFDTPTVTRIMTRIGSSTSGYKYITVALKMLSKDPISITFYRDKNAKDQGNNYEVEQHQIQTVYVKDGATVSNEAYYTYYANTFNGITLPSVLSVEFTTHFNSYENVQWVTTTGEAIVYKPNTTLHLVSDIREWKETYSSTLSRMTREDIEEMYTGWIIETVYTGSFASSRMNGQSFLDNCIFSSSGAVSYTFGDFDRIRLYRKIDLIVHLDVVIDNYVLSNFEMPSESDRGGSIFDRYVLVDIDGNRSYQKIGDLVQWSSDDPTKVGLYYNGINSEKGYIIISNGTELDQDVPVAEVGVFTRAVDENTGEAFYTSYDSYDLQEFINLIYKVADVTLTQKAFDYSLPYAQVEMYQYYEDDPTDNSSTAFIDISRIEVDFTSYSTGAYTRSAFSLVRTVEGGGGSKYAVNVVDGRVRVRDISGLNIVSIAFADLISMIVANELKEDIRLWTVESITRSGIEIRRDSQVLTSYSQADFDTAVTKIKLRSPDGLQTIDFKRDEVLYRWSYLNNHVSVSTRNTVIRDKNVSIDGLSGIMNVNDMVATLDNNVPRQIEVSNVITQINESAKWKYVIPLGTGVGAYDVNVILAFRNGYYYDSGSGADSSSTITIQAYNTSGQAQYSKGYNLGDKIAINDLSGVKILSGGSYTEGTNTKFSYNSLSNKLEYWYVVESDIPGVVTGTTIKEIPAEAIYRTGSDSGGSAVISTITKEGFYLTRKIVLEVLPEYIDDDTVDTYSSSSGGSAMFVIDDGIITIENIYEYDKSVGLSAYLKDVTYIPTSLTVTVGGQQMSIYNVQWSLYQDEWLFETYNTLNYKGTNNEDKLFAEAMILGYQDENNVMHGQIRLILQIRIASAEIEILPWADSQIGLDTDVYYVGNERHFTIYVDAYNDKDSAALGKDEFTLPTIFEAITVGGTEPFTFENVRYNYGVDKTVTKIYYNQNGIDIERMTAQGAQLEATGINDRRALNLLATIGRDKTEQKLNVTFYFYDKEATLTEAVLSISDTDIREIVSEMLTGEKSVKQSEILSSINVKRLKYNLELILDQAQKLQSNIVNNYLPTAAEINGTISQSTIRSMLYAAIPIASADVIQSVQAVEGVALSQDLCESFALYYLRKEAEALADYYAGEIVRNRKGVATTDLNSATRLLSDYITAYRDQAYNNMIQAYLEIEFNRAFASYMSRVTITDLTDSVEYKNAVEGAFDTERLLNNIQKLRRLIGKGGLSTDSVALYVKQFDLTYATKYGYIEFLPSDSDEKKIEKLYRAMMIEEIYRAVFAADEKFKLSENGRFLKVDDDLMHIRQTVIETLFARMGLIDNYHVYSRAGVRTFTYDEKGIMVEVVNGDYSKVNVPCAILAVSGDYQSSYLMPGTLKCTMAGYIDCAMGDYDSRQLRSAINAVVERWFDFAEVETSGDNDPLAEFKALSPYIIRNSFTTIERYDSSIYTIRRSLVNGTDFTSTLNTLLTKAIGNFLTRIYVEKETVAAIRQARSLNKNNEVVYVLPTSDVYRDYLAYYVLQKVEEDDFGDVECYEQDEDSYYHLTEDTTYDADKSYYQFIPATEDVRYFPVSVQKNTYNLSLVNVLENSPIEDVYYEYDAELGYYETNDEYFILQEGKQYYYYGDAMALGAAVDTEPVYVESMSLENAISNFGDEKYYEFIPIIIITDNTIDVVQAGSRINDNHYYLRSSATKYERESVGSYFDASKNYYRFYATYELGEEYYYSLDMSDNSYSVVEEPTTSDIQNGLYYCIRPVYVVSTAGNVAVRAESDIDSIGYHERRVREENGVTQYYDSEELVYAYYERRADGKFYLTSDLVFNERHTYYARQILRAGEDYATGDTISSWEEANNKTSYREVAQSRMYLRVALYRTDVYNAFINMPYQYNVLFDEEIGGPAYRTSINWNRKGAAQEVDYRGGEADLYKDINEAATGISQQVNEKLEVQGHVVEEDLVIRDAVAELAMEYFVYAHSSGPQPTTTEYTDFAVTGNGSGGYVVTLVRDSDGRKYSVTIVNIARSGEPQNFAISYMDAFDTEGYLMYRFANTYEGSILVNQSVSVYNPFEFKQSDLPGLVIVDGNALKIVWKDVSIQPTGNITDTSPEVKGNIVNSRGQEVTMGLYVASWSFSGLYQPTTSESGQSVSFEVNNETWLFTYINPINVYFSIYNTHSSVDCYLVDFSVRIKQEDGSVRYVSMYSNGSISTHASSGAFIKKLFYPASGTISGVNTSSRMLEYDTDDDSMSSVLVRRRYLLYWDETAVSSLLSDASHERRSGSLSLGNDDIGSFAISGLVATNDTTTSTDVVYRYEAMSISTLQVTPQNVTVASSMDANKNIIVKLDMPHYYATFTVVFDKDMNVKPSQCVCSVCNSVLTVTAVEGGYNIRCPKGDCKMSKHTLLYNLTTGECGCIGTGECECALYNEIAPSLVGRSGNITLVMDVNSTYPETGVIELNENMIKYDRSDLIVRLLWNQTYETVISNLRKFVRESYDVDTSAIEFYAMNLFMNWTNMSESEQNDVIRLAVEYNKSLNAKDKTYTDAKALQDTYKLLAINERYDFVSYPERLTGGGDTGVIATVLVLVNGSANVYRESVSVKVIFSDFTPQGYYATATETSVYLPREDSGDINTYFEEVNLLRSMIGKTIPQNTYFVDSEGKKVLTKDTTFKEGTTYYRLKTDMVFISVLADYWDDATDLDVYTKRDKIPPYDNVGDDVYKLLHFISKTKEENGEYEQVLGFRRIQIDNIYWKYNEVTCKMTSESFVISVDGVAYTITSSMLTLTLTPIQ